MGRGWGNFFHYHAVLGNNLAKLAFAPKSGVGFPSRLGNPGSVTGQDNKILTSSRHNQRSIVASPNQGVFTHNEMI